MQTATFTAWLRRQRHRRDPVGDLAQDVRMDPTWPPCRSLTGFQRHLERRAACDGALDALEQAWLEWKESADHPTGRMRHPTQPRT